MTTGFAQETVAETDAPPAAEVTTESAPPPAPALNSAEALANQPVIPTPYAGTRYEKTWDKNPFLLKTKPPETKKETWAQDWALAGMFNNEGKIRVSIVNKQTGEYKHLSNQGNTDPEFQLVKANFNRDRTDASANIAKGADEQTITYDDNLTSRPVTINNTQQATAPVGGAPGAQGAAGNPTGRPGGQVKPGAVPMNRTGMPVVPGAVNPTGIPVNNNPNVINNSGPVPITPPPVSRRRQLIPGTVPQAPQ
jgi:hypothetical protein